MPPKDKYSNVMCKNLSTLKYLLMTTCLSISKNYINV